MTSHMSDTWAQNTSYTTVKKRISVKNHLVTSYLMCSFRNVKRSWQSLATQHVSLGSCMDVGKENRWCLLQDPNKQSFSLCTKKEEYKPFGSCYSPQKKHQLLNKLRNMESTSGSVLKQEHILNTFFPEAFPEIHNTFQTMIEWAVDSSKS